MTGKSYLTCIFLFGISLASNSQVSCLQTDSLKLVQNYQKKQIEYERIVFLSDNEYDIQTALYNRALCFKAMDEFGRAFNTLRRISFSSTPDSLKFKMKYELALCAYLSNNVSDAEYELSMLNIDNMDDRSKSQYFLLRALTLNELQQWDEAKNIIEKYLACIPPITDSIQKLLFVKYNHRPVMRKHELANYLQIIPGLGQWYAGKPLEGIANLGLNAAFLSFGVYEVYYKYYITGYFVGGIGLSKFYFGGHNRTDFLIDQMNYKRAQKFNDEIKRILTTL